MLAVLPTISEGGVLHLLAPAAAFAAGVATSLHCVGMCGPMSCAILQGGKRAPSLQRSQCLYHIGRLISYSLLGCVAGFAGSGVLGALGAESWRVFPWVMVAVFLALGLGVDAWATRWQARGGWGRSLLQRAYRASGTTRGLALGIATPLIPCGPLYMMLWAAAASGSATAGLVAMASFAMGTAPLLFAAQSGWSRLSERIRPNTLRSARRGLCLAAAVLIGFRALLDTDLASLASGGLLCH